MKGPLLTGILASMGVLAHLTGNAALGQTRHPRAGSQTRIVDLRPLLVRREIDDGLLPLHVAPDGLQLWARVQEGQVRDWIATDSQLLDRALGERHDWRGPDALLFAV